jgi:hypothetical protein
LTSRANAECTNTCSRTSPVSRASGMIAVVMITSQPLTAITLDRATSQSAAAPAQRIDGTSTGASIRRIGGVEELSRMTSRATTPIIITA